MTSESKHFFTLSIKDFAREESFKGLNLMEHNIFMIIIPYIWQDYFYEKLQIQLLFGANKKRQSENQANGTLEPGPSHCIKIQILSIVFYLHIFGHGIINKNKLLSAKSTKEL